MTCIVGIELPGSALIAADSFIGSDSSEARDQLAGSKIQRVHDQLWAFAGGLILAQHLPDIVKRRRRGQPLDSYLRMLSMSFRTSAAELNALCEGHIDADFMLAIEGKIMVLNSDLTWTRSARGYNAIGVGAPYALGALYATRTTRSSANTRAEQAIAAAAQHCNAVLMPAKVEVL